MVSNELCSGIASDMNIPRMTFFEFISVALFGVRFCHIEHAFPIIGHYFYVSR